MTWRITIDDDRDFEWLKGIIFNAKLKSDKGLYVPELAATVNRLYDNFFSSQKEGVDEDLVDEVAAAITDQLSDSSPRGRAAGINDKPRLCPSHLAYAAKRPPRTSCEGCWSAYERMEPIKHPQARRKFEAAQRKKAEA